MGIQHHLRHDHLATTERYVHKLKETRSVVNALAGLKEGIKSKDPQEAPKKRNGVLTLVS